MANLKLLGICGALRAQSTNRKLMLEAARLFGPCDFSQADIRFPLYDGDDEQASGIPDVVRHVQRQIKGADAVIISTPEYNKAPSGVLKNALDWISRDGGLALWHAKPVAVMSAAAGRAGGERAQTILRACMVSFRPMILQGPEIHLADSSNQFDDDGRLTGEIYVRELTALMQALRTIAQRD
tara:strand:- start:83447 stop:83995 length:549 start_codon:yes stop_codon:yes gene_type:complete